MWRAQTSRQGRQIFNAAKRRFATDPGNVQPPVPPPTPIVQQSGFGKLIKFFGLTAIPAAGGVAGYAYFDPEFRKQVEGTDYIGTYAKDLLDMVLPAPEVAAPLVVAKPQDVVAPALDPVPIVSTQEPLNLASKSEEPLVKQEMPGSSQTLPCVTEAEVEEKPKQETAQALEMEKKPEPKVEQEKVVETLISREEIEKADNAALEVAIHKLLTSSQTLTQESVEAQQAVAHCTRAHTKLLKQAMDDSQEILKKDDQWEAVAVAFKEKENAVIRANDLLEETKKSIDKLREVLTDSKKNTVTKKNPAIYPATKAIVKLTNEMGTANAKVRQAESEARVMLKYKDLVDKGKKQFQRELESIMPDVKIGATSKKLTEDELNSLIAHAHRRIEQLQKQLAEQMSMERQRLGKALDAQRQEDSEMTRAAVADEAERLHNEFESEKHKLEMDFLVRQEGEVRKQLSRQAGAHSDHIKDVLAVQREQLQLEFQRELNCKILEEREQFQSEVAGWISRLKGIESAVDARASSEKLARCAQDLWLTCITLNSVITFGNEEDSEALVPIKKEVEAVLKVGNKHPFVETILKALPALALERGVYTEEMLRKRFVKVAKVSRRLGLMSASNTSLYQYLVSMLQSLVVLDTVQALELTDQVDLSELDNYGLVAHAEHFMAQGDLETALKFMVQLSGESAVAAGDWVREARLLLETRQAATSLTAYASATGLANTF